MNIRIFSSILLSIILFFIYSLSCASTFSITPANFAVLPTSISEGQHAMAYFIVKNNTSALLKGNKVRYLPTNVEQVTTHPVFKNTCSVFFDLSPKGTVSQRDDEPEDWCFLQLKISGAVDSSNPNPEQHLTVCNGDLECSKIDSKEHELNVIYGISNSLARFSVVMEHFEETTKTIKSILYASTDGGIGWEPQEIPGSIGYPRAVTCKGKEGKFCIIVGDSYAKGQNGDTTTLLAYTSKDGGVNWRKHILGLYGATSGLSDVTCNGENGEYCVAVGAYTPISNKHINMAPIVYTTSDNGESWTPNYPETFDSLVGARMSAVSCSGSSGQECTAMGLYYSGYENNSNTTTFLSYTSSDGGKNWISHILEKHPGIAELKSIKCNYSGQNCIAVGQLNDRPIDAKPLIYKSTNGGTDWTYSIPSEGIGGVLDALTCDKFNQNCTAVGSVIYSSGKTEISYPIIYQSKDGGVNWVSKKFTGCRGGVCGKSFKAISCSNEGKYCTAIASAHSNKKIIPIVYISLDGGANWRPRDNTSFSNYKDFIRNVESIGILESSFE